MNTQEQQRAIGDPSWVLDPIAGLPDVRHALILTADGMLLGASKDLPRDQGDAIAAMSSALQGAARALAGATRAEDSESDPVVETVTVEIDRGIYVVMPSGQGTNAYLAVIAGPQVQMGIVVQAMAKQANRLGEELMAVKARTTVSDVA